MKSPSVRKIGVILCGLMAVSMSLSAQVKVFFRQTDVSATSGGTVLLKAMLVNAGSRPGKGAVSMDAGALQVLNAAPDSIFVPAADSLFIPVLLYVPRRTDAARPCMVRLTVESADGRQAEALCRVHVKAERRLYLAVRQPDIYMIPREDTLRIPLQIHNNGNRQEMVTITLKDQWTNKLLLHITTLLPGFTDTALSLSAVLSSPLLNRPASHILVEGKYEDGAVFSTVQLNVFNTSSSRNYGMDVGNETPLNNSLGFFTRFPGADRPYYELLGKGLLDAGKNRLGYQVDALYYPAVPEASLVLMNTQLNYLAGKWNAQIGNIYKNEEMLLNGRGINFQFTPSPSAKWEAGYVNDNYNLAGKFSGSGGYNAHALYAGYSAVLKKNMGLKGLFIQQWDPDYYGNSTLVGGSLSFIVRRDHQLQLGAYASDHIKGMNLKDSSGNYGAALILSYSGTAGKWQMQSDNYLSTPSYAGFQKGAVNLSQRVSYTPNNRFNFWAGFNRISNRAQYFYADNGYFNPSYVNETAEWGLNRYLRKNLQVTFRPYYSYARSQNDFLSSKYDYRIRAIHLNVNLDYNGAHRQNWYLNADAGWSSSNQIAYRHYWAYKIMATYTLGAFSVNTGYQDGPYYPGELALYRFTGQKYRLYSISPAFNGHFFHHKLLLNAYNSVAYENSYRRWTDNISLSLTCRLKYHFNLVARYNKIQYFMNTPGIHQFDLGIVKKFGARGQGKTYTLTLHFFSDDNGDGQWNPGEKPVINQLVKIDQDIFRTDNSGTVVDKRVPAGNIHLSVLQSNGLMARDTTIGVYRKTTAYIPLDQIGVVYGHIQLRQQQYSYDTDGDIAGIRIAAMDETGQRFEAVTDEKGDFLFYLPLNTYRLELETASLPGPYSCPQAVQAVDLLREQEQKITFTVWVKQRKVEIKKFRSSN